MKTKHFLENRLSFVSVVAGLVVCAISPLQAAAETDAEPINWYYSAAYGTGVYKTENSTVTVFRIPLFKTLREPEPGHWGVNALMPITLGYHNYKFGDILGLDLPSDLGTISVVPGVEFRYQVTDQWLLKPFGQVGFGLSLDGGSSALIHAFGVRSRYQLDYNWMLGNALYVAGYEASYNDRDSSVVFITGLNHTRPVSWQTFGRETDLGLHLNYYLYPDKMEFDEVLDDPVSVLQEGEVAVTIGWPKLPTLLGVPIERLGIAYRFSDNLKGWRLVTEYPF